VASEQKAVASGYYSKFGLLFQIWFIIPNLVQSEFCQQQFGQERKFTPIPDNQQELIIRVMKLQNRIRNGSRLKNSQIIEYLR